jgi:hypothetical protein
MSQRKSTIIIILSSVFILCVFILCIITLINKNKIIYKNAVAPFKELELGMTKEQIICRIGQPYEINSSRQSYDIWNYKAPVKGASDQPSLYFIKDNDSLIKCVWGDIGLYKSRLEERLKKLSDSKIGADNSFGNIRVNVHNAIIMEPYGSYVVLYAHKELKIGKNEFKSVGYGNPAVNPASYKYYTPVFTLDSLIPGKYDIFIQAFKASISIENDKLMWQPVIVLSVEVKAAEISIVNVYDCFKLVSVPQDPTQEHVKYIEWKRDTLDK